MGSAGVDGANDMDWTNTASNNADLGSSAVPEGLGQGETLSDVTDLGSAEPMGTVEIVEIETADDGLDALGLELENVSGFRWWYIPAVAVPVAAGAAGAAIWLSRRNRTTPGSQLASTYAALTKQGQSMLRQVRANQNTQQAAKTVQQGISSVRESAKGLPDQASALRDRSLAALAAIDIAEMVDQTRGIWNNALDQMSTLWERNTSAAREAVKQSSKTTARTRPRAASALAGQAAAINQWLARRQRPPQAAKVADRASDLQRRANQWMAQRRAQQALAAAKSRATAPVAKATMATSKGVRKTGRAVNSGFRQARAFGFGMLVSAMLTYVRIWQSRLSDRELRETAGGRMVRDSGPVKAGAVTR